MSKGLKTILFFSFIVLLTLSNTALFAASWDKLFVEKNGSVLLGEWRDFPTWSPSVKYNYGDIVFHNGQYWIRISKAKSKIEPSVNPPGRNFWRIYD